MGETREALSTSDRDSAPIKVVADVDSSRDAQPVSQERGGHSRRRRRDSGASAAKSIAPIETPVPDEEEKSSSTNGSKGKSRTERSDRRERRERPSEPPEVVVVEMTPQEQEIYALMGISPLVLSTETIKNPKTAIVSVAAPGEQRQVQQMIMADVLQGQKSESAPDADKSEPSFPVPSRSNRSTPASGSESTPSRKVIQTPPAQPAEESPSLTSMPDTASRTEQEPAVPASAGNDGDGDTGKTRRRRRRSSASSS